MQETIELSTQLARIQEHLKNQDSVLDELKYAILGNGTPGLKIIVDRIDNRLGSVELKQKATDDQRRWIGRTVAAEAVKQCIVGLFSALVALGGFWAISHTSAHAEPTPAINATR